MTDITHQEIMETLVEIKQTMATKAELAQVEARLEAKIAAKASKTDLERVATKDDIARLEHKMDGYHKVNIGHHLETRSMIGDLNQKYDHLREGLLKAAGAA